MVLPSGEHGKTPFVGHVGFSIEGGEDEKSGRDRPVQLVSQPSSKGVASVAAIEELKSHYFGPPVGASAAAQREFKPPRSTRPKTPVSENLGGFQDGDAQRVPFSKRRVRGSAIYSRSSQTKGAQILDELFSNRKATQDRTKHQTIKIRPLQPATLHTNKEVPLLNAVFEC